MDYGALVPIRARWQWGGLAGSSAFTPDANGLTPGCSSSNTLWTAAPHGPEYGGGGRGPLPLAGANATNPAFQYWGVIVRGPYFREGSAAWYTNFTAPMTFARITDGASHTSVVTEKRVNPATYTTGSDPPDDRGWSDGWDYDTLRVAVCVPHPDSDNHTEFTNTAGSAHTAGINTGFADGSVQFINYDIEPEMFNRMAHRSDGE